MKHLLPWHYEMFREQREVKKLALPVDILGRAEKRKAKKKARKADAKRYKQAHMRKAA
jgi:hypothetical protein